MDVVVGRLNSPTAVFMVESFPLIFLYRNLLSDNLYAKAIVSYFHFYFPFPEGRSAVD